MRLDEDRNFPGRRSLVRQQPVPSFLAVLAGKTSMAFHIDVPNQCLPSTNGKCCQSQC